MSDLTASHCGCDNHPSDNNGCGSILWIIILLSLCGGNGGMGGICGGGCGGSGGICGGNGNGSGCDSMIFLILILCCCGGGSSIC